MKHLVKPSGELYGEDGGKQTRHRCPFAPGDVTCSDLCPHFEQSKESVRLTCGGVERIITLDGGK